MSDEHGTTGGLDGQRRAKLALKGRLLYNKACGTKGQGTCAENFALYHLRRGEIEVVHDFLDFLSTQCEALSPSDPEGQREMTEGLLDRVLQHLQAQQSAGVETETPHQARP